ncbi:MAG TPA: hypothetical protein VIX89_15590 [Bryobacteraceae bacterium]
MPQEDKRQTRSRLRGFIDYFRSPSRAYPIIIFSAYLLLITFYFAYWAPQHRNQLLDQDVRQLAAAGDQIRSKIESLTLILQTQIANAEQRSAAPIEESNRNVPTGFAFEKGCPSPGATTENNMLVVDSTTPVEQVKCSICSYTIQKTCGSGPGGAIRRVCERVAHKFPLQEICDGDSLDSLGLHSGRQGEGMDASAW